MAGISEGGSLRGAADAAAPSENKNETARKPILKSKPQVHNTTEFSVIDFCLFSSINLVAALHAPIQDCDETFNYWEPTHYLDHGYGLQTWEYSPEYAIRSWLYIVIHAVPGKVASLFSKKGAYQFYVIRGLLGLACAYAQTRLFCMISKEIGSRIARIFQLIMLSSSGMFYASVAYLPSSFAMLTTMMGMTEFVNWQTGLKTANGITWFGLGAIVGWPFSGALILPLFLDELVYVSLAGISDSAFRVLNGVVRVAIISAIDFVVNVFFYHKLVFVPWRIVSYNIFSGSSRGPDIFGTEPWHFYIRNLLLNFHIWFLLALCAGPIIMLQFLSRSYSTTKMSLLRSLMFITPFYLWLAVFSLQPHKEERFMYPAYPFLCLNAAITAHNVLFYLGHSNPQTLIGKLPAKLKLLGMIGLASFAVVIGLLRTAGTVTAYHAPLEIYQPLQNREYANMEGAVCLGKEWHRFPSSYFLPKNMRARFVKSSFDGLLPGQFSEASIGFGLFPTWLVPSGMNDRNMEDPGKHINIKHCSFLVDSQFSTDLLHPNALEPSYLGDLELQHTWERLECRSFMDTVTTHPVARIFWVPDWDIVPQRYRRRWGAYCLMHQR